MSKLQILIPQYKEDNETIKPLLDSIAFQQGIDLKNDIEVFIGNDGSDVKLSVDFLKTYPYRIQYHFFEHGGLAATRQKLYHLATADYVMWCDADDKFISSIALQLIIDQTHEQFDALICDFFEEHKGPRFRCIPHHDDAIFVHGKVYSRKFLEENKIEWNPTLREHQDSAFNVLARTLAKKTRIIAMPLYMWCDNPKSVCRHDGIYHSPNTWIAMIDSYNSVIEDFSKRGYGDQARYYAKWCLYATYYEMAHEVWFQDDVLERKAKTCAYLVRFYKKHELLIQNCTDKQTEEIQKRTQEIASRKGKLKEMPPFEEWLNSLLNLY